jgi:hypothetical protein
MSRLLRVYKVTFPFYSPGLIAAPENDMQGHRLPMQPVAAAAAAPA